MKKKVLTAGILTTLVLVPGMVGAADGFIPETVRTNLDYIRNLIVGALIFFMKSRKTI